MPPIMTIEEVAVLCQCSTRTVEDHARSSRQPGLKMGDPWVFPSEALMRAINRLAEEEATTRSRPTDARAVKKLVPVKTPTRPNLAALG